MEISQNMFYIIIAIIVFVGLIIAIIQWRKVRKVHNEVEFLNKLAENKKTDMEDRGLEPQNVMSEIVLPKEQQEKLGQVRKSISNLMRQEGCLPSQVDDRFKRLESSTRGMKFKKLLLKVDDGL
ncbi:MAG TPA: hypothetical protein VLR54_04550 [Methanobacteriaceae archaeon]|nr:hypothetical protein [Methanobacteriaceae archaeon]